ncbi:MAG: tail fiber domain-containing protein [Patescibacteria group bacterium]
MDLFNKQIDAVLDSTDGSTSDLSLASFDTDDLAVGSTNLYFTDELVASYISGSSTIARATGNAYGDLLYWTGSAWNSIATSSLGIVGGSYGNTDANAYIHASSTIPKAYTANVFSALQTFGNASTSLLSVSGNSYFPGGIWNSSGNLGVGSTSPYAKLSVTGDTVFNGNLLVTGTTTSNGFVLNSNKTFYVGNEVFIDSEGNINASVLPLQDTSTNLSAVVPESGERIYETDTGLTKVGNGLTATGNLMPFALGTINSSTQYYVPFYASTTGRTLSGTSSIIVKNEKIGIGNSNPVFDLDVDGVIGNSATLQNLTIQAGIDTSGDDANILLKANSGDNSSISLNATGAISLQSASVGGTGLSLESDAGINLTTTDSGGFGSHILLTPASSNFVGIATSSPWRTLSVTGTVAFNGLTTSAVGNAVCITAGREITTANSASCLGVSSQRFKKNIEDADLGLSTIHALRPVTFDYKEGYGDSGKDQQFGLIAEEAYDVDRRLAVLDAKGVPTTVRYDFLPTILIKAVKELSAKVDDLIDQGLGSLKALVTESLTIGSSSKPSGITLYDEDTGSPYCLTVKAGKMRSAAGECGATSTENPPTIPDIVPDPVTDDSSDADPTASSTEPTSPSPTTDTPDASDPIVEDTDASPAEIPVNTDTSDTEIDQTPEPSPPNDDVPPTEPDVPEEESPSETP